ncbi:MAG: cytochrome c oxidase assembly protein [Hyphomicrobiaceae bacterium]
MTGAIAVSYAWPQSLTGHMLGHAALMSALAPLVALCLVRPGLSLAIPRPHLGLSTALQIGALWLLHAPSVLAAVVLHDMIGIAASAGLLVTAVLFWVSILDRKSGDRGYAVLALLVTGKLFCLLAALLVFAPRPLYSLVCYGSGAGDPLAAQQLAGLVMIVICPATYVAAGLLIASRMLADLSRPAGSQGRRA